MEERPWFRHYDPGVPRRLEVPEKVCHEFLEARAAGMPEGTALTFMGMPLTYREVNARSNRFAHALRAWGLKKGDRVAMVMGNSPAFVSCQFGILKAGGVVVPVNPLYTGRELEHVLGDSGARLAVVLSLFVENVIAVKGGTALEAIIAVPIPGMEIPLPEGTILLEAFMEGKPEHNPGLDMGSTDPALVIYTGGTTGRSKGAVLHHRSQVYCATMLSTLDPSMTTQQDAFLLVMPLFHIMGNAIMTFCIHDGLPIHLVPRYDPKLLLEDIHRLRPTWFPGVPTIFIGVMHHPDVKDYDLTSLRYCISGAAPFPVEAMEEFEAITRCRVNECFGLTEAGSAVLLNPFVNRRKFGSIGIPTPGMDARIVDLETGTRELPQGEEGELVLKGPPIMMHYHNMPEETALALRDGWLHTGDIARMDADGYFWIVDRIKDMIIIGGENVYPREIDEVLYEHPKVELACAVGVPDPYKGEAVKAFVVPRSGETLTDEEVVAFCRERLAPFKVPKIVEIRATLPTSVIGKVSRKVLREEERQKRNSKS
jgi:long-chain acyl-CoA synthetase